MADSQVMEFEVEIEDVGSDDQIEEVSQGTESLEPLKTPEVPQPTETPADAQQATDPTPTDQTPVPDEIAETPTPVTEAPVTEPPSDIISDGVAKFEQSRLRLEHEIAEISMRLLETADVSKSLKKRRDCLTEELSQLLSDGPTPVRRETKPAASETNQATGETIGATTDEPINQQQPVNESTDWRSVPLGNLNLKKGVHSKLEDAGIETIGQLEDLRAAISNGKKEWPKGIGEAKITEIEDAVIAWLTKNRDSSLFSTSGTSPGPVAEPAAAFVYPTPNEWEEWTDSKRAVYLTKRAATLNDDGSSCEKPADSSHWDAGFESFDRGCEITDCPYSPGEWQDNWIRGFLNANSVAGDESSESETDQQSESATDTPDHESDSDNSANATSSEVTEGEPVLPATPELAMSGQADNYGMANPVGRWTLEDL